MASKSRLGVAAPVDANKTERSDMIVFQAMRGRVAFYERLNDMSRSLVRMSRDRTASPKASGGPEPAIR